VTVAAVAGGEKHSAVGRKDNARAEMTGGAQFRPLAEQHLYIIQSGSVGAELAAGKRGGTGAARPGLRIRQIDKPVRGKGRMQRHVEHPALATTVDRRDAAERFGHFAVRCHQAQPAGFFGDDDRAVRQEIDTPGMVQPVGDDAHGNPALFGVEDPVGGGRPRTGSGAGKQQRDTGGERGKSADHGGPSWVMVGTF